MPAPTGVQAAIGEAKQRRPTHGRRQVRRLATNFHPRFGKRDLGRNIGIALPIVVDDPIVIEGHESVVGEPVVPQADNHGHEIVAAQPPAELAAKPLGAGQGPPCLLRFAERIHAIGADAASDELDQHVGRSAAPPVTYGLSVRSL
jgi:hypothetical protein